MKWYHVDVPKMLLVLACVLLFVIFLTSCASTPASVVRPGGPAVMGCTAVMTTTGSVLLTQVVVVGITPQGTQYWVRYPNRTPRFVNGHAVAELLPAEYFTAAGMNGHTPSGHAYRCPQRFEPTQPDTADVSNGVAP